MYTKEQKLRVTLNLNLNLPDSIYTSSRRDGGAFPVPRLELLGAEVAERGVRPHPVVEALDVLEYLQRRLLAALEGARVHALRLHEAHQRLHRGVVPRRRDRPRRGPDAVVAHGAAEPERHVLRPVVRVVYAARRRPPAGDRHPERVVGQRGAHAVGHRPPDDPPGPYVHHERQVEPPAAGAHVGDVGEPRLVGARCAEVAPHQVRRRVGLRRGRPRRPLGASRAAAGGALPPVVAHEARHALARRAHPAAQQLHVHLRGAVDAAARLVDLRDQPRELEVALVALWAACASTRSSPVG